MKRRTFLKSLGGVLISTPILFKQTDAAKRPFFTTTEQLERWLYETANEIVGNVGPDSYKGISPTNEEHDIEYALLFNDLNNNPIVNSWVQFIEGKKTESILKLDGKVTFKGEIIRQQEPTIYWRIKPEINKVRNKNAYSFYTRFLISTKEIDRDLMKRRPNDFGG